MGSATGNTTSVACRHVVDAAGDPTAAVAAVAGGPETAQAVEHQVVRRPQRLAATPLEEALDLPRGKVDGLDPPWPGRGEGPLLQM